VLRQPRHHPDLLQEPHHVFFRPLLYELPIHDSVDCDRGHLQVVAGTQSTWQISLVFPYGCQAGHYPVAFCDLILDSVIPRSGVLKDSERLFQTFTPRGQSGEWRRIVIDVIVGDEFIEDADVALVDFLVKSAAPVPYCFQPLS